MKTRIAQGASLFAIAVVLCISLATLAMAHNDSNGITPLVKDGPGPTYDPSTDPDQGLSDQIHAKDRAVIDAQIARNREFALKFEREGGDARILPREESWASVAGAPESLSDAISKSVIIVQARVNATHFSGDDVVVELAVDDVVKGDSSPTIWLTQGGGPILDEIAQRPALVEMHWDPLLLEGDEAVLFLQPDPVNIGRYIVVPGQNYGVIAGHIVVAEQNGFAEFSGVTAEELLAAVRANM